MARQVRPSTWSLLRGKETRVASMFLTFARVAEQPHEVSAKPSGVVHACRRLPRGPRMTTLQADLRRVKDVKA
jgi:hypothetical protein